MTEYSTTKQLDPREEHFRIPGPNDGMSFFLRFLPASGRGSAPQRSVLYVHGATFPSALSIAHRFDGRFWRDELDDAGFDVWGLDFYGFGHSDRYPEMIEPDDSASPLCGAHDAAKQLEVAVRFIVAHQRIQKLSLISHSWGSMPASLVASSCPAVIDRLVLFGPVAERGPRRYETPPALSAWRLVTLQDQWNRFVEDVPAPEAPVLSKPISRTGANATSTVIRKAANGILLVLRPRLVRSTTSSMRGMAGLLATLVTFNAQWRSSAATGTA